MNGFILTFTALSALGMLLLTVASNTVWVSVTRDILFTSHGGDRAAIPDRMFVGIFMITFAFYVATNVWRRLLIATELIGALVGAAIALDLLSRVLNALAHVVVPAVGQQIASSLVAMLLFPVVVLHNAQLPPPIIQPRGSRIRTSSWCILSGTVLVAFIIAASVLERRSTGIEWLRDVALLGGIGPGLFLVQQLCAFILAMFGVRAISRSRRTSFSAPIAVLVPAHNEAHGIAATVAAVDRAAAAYPATVRIYVVDNGSTDATIEAATAAIAACTVATGTVLECAEPGKAIALNYGMAHIDEPFVVRIDADTIVGPECFTRAMGHFHNPRVGAVGGLPIPTTLTTFFDRARFVESLVRHGFFQVTLMGIDGVLGVPGMFVCYRRAALDVVGPIVEGMNGEDTDICVRMNSAGYRSLIEPRAVFYSETPRTWAHMREQRTRWFRSGYHIAGRNRQAMFAGHSMAGTVVMPFQLVTAARRAMLAPSIIFGTLMITVFHQTFADFRWQPLVATVLGMSLIVAAGVCLAYGKRRALLYLPEYLAFRVIRSYFTIAAVLSLVYPPLDPVLALRSRWGRT